MNAAIAAFRAKQNPAIVQVFEVGTATMMGGQGRDLSRHRADEGQRARLRSQELSARRHGLLHRHSRQHAVVPVQLVDADPLLEQDRLQGRRPRSRQGAQDLEGHRGDGQEDRRLGRQMRLHHAMAELGADREFLGAPQRADRHQGQRLRRPRHRVQDQLPPARAPRDQSRQMAEGENLPVRRPRAATPTRNSSPANAPSTWARRRAARPCSPTPRPSRSASACCPTTTTSRARRRTRSSAAPRCGC